MGKTVTTELATYAPGKTRNPHEPRAHARRLVERLGRGRCGRHRPARGRHADQRLGDPAGVVLRRGRLQAVVRPASAPWRAAAIGAARPHRRLCAQRRRRRTARAGARRRRLRRPELDALPAALDRRPPGAPPALAIVRTPFWDRVDAGAREAFDAFVAKLGERARPMDLPRSAADAVTWHRTIMEADIAASFEAEYEQGRDRLSASLRGQIERGRTVTGVDYRRALARRATLADRSTRCSTMSTPSSRRPRWARRRPGSNPPATR